MGVTNAIRLLTFYDRGRRILTSALFNTHLTRSRVGLDSTAHAHMHLSVFELKVWRFIYVGEGQMDPIYEYDAPHFLDFELLKQGLADDQDADMWFGELRYLFA